ASVERGNTLDAEDVRLDPFDVRPERDEETTEVLYVRLAGCVADHRLSRREDGGHDGVLGRHDARLVEEDVLAAQAACGTDLEARAHFDLCAELCECMNVRIESAPADHVSPRRRHAHRA